MAEAISYTYHSQTVPIAVAYLVRSTDNAVIPPDLGNMDYQAFLAWMAEGNPAPTGWSGPTNASG